MEHPDEGRIRGYAQRTLGPADLLAVDDHLAACAECRRRAARAAGAARRGADLPGALLPPDSHLSDEDVSDYVAGRLRAPDRAAVDAHLAACATCAREVGELRAWAGRRQPLGALWYAAAAAVILAVLVPVLMRARSSVGPEGFASLTGLDGLPALQRQQVEAALRDGAAQPPPYLAELEGAPETLMGPSPAASFRVIEPVATAVVSDRPTFRWEPLAGAERYTVAVSDEAMRPVARSPALSGTTWTPEQPLPRGRTYAWQVTANRAAGTVTAPAPPAPLAKIRILDEETARILDQAAAARPDGHVVLGILYAQAGARAQAESHLAQVARTDPHFEVAQRTLDRLRRPPAAADGRRPR